MKHIINVSCKLPSPEDHTRKKQTSSEFGPLIEDSEKNTCEIQRIGWTGHPAPSHKERDEISRKLMREHKQTPVFLTESQIENYYKGFCNSSLWPLLHYISTLSQYDESWWKHYCEVNKIFADKIIERYRDGDLVWIHDYPLMLVPKYIKEKTPEAKVGFFLHTPFPSYELFRCHPNREDLLSGVLSSDLIGFQTFGYLRHFRSTVLRLLGVESEINQIHHEGSITGMGVYPVGVKCNLINDVIKSDEYKNSISEYKKNFEGKQIALSVDRLDLSQGIIKKLTAIETFLRENPARRDNVVFFILTIPTGDQLDQFEYLTHDVEHAVGRINGKFSSMNNIPIHFINKSVSFNQLCALYSIADIALVTPLMDGMNLIAKEYVACNPEGNGVLILSEFAGASQELFNAIMVNPYNNHQMTNAINRALLMSDPEKQKRLHSMLKRIRGYDSVYWAKTFIADLDRSSQTPRDSTRILDDSIIDRFKQKGTRKALFLDYDGSLREFVDNPSDAVPSEELIKIFEKFDQREDLDLYIVSGRDKDFLEEHFGKFHFTLIGEHGYFIKPAGGKWKTLAGNIDLGWKETILEIFRLYSFSTPGSRVEEKHSSIVWHYRQSDPEFGAWKAASLIGELTETISNLPVCIHHGQKIVEVNSQHVSKGLAVAKYMNENDYDLVLCAGDDKTDETMLYFDDDSVVTVKVGNKETDADFRTATPGSFRRFLNTI